MTTQVAKMTCRTTPGCPNQAVYLMPKKAPVQVGWVPCCYDHAENWFKGKTPPGEVLEIDVTNDYTLAYMGAPQKED